IAGIGFGPGFTGAYRVVVARSTPNGRASLIAAIFTVSYLAFSVPAVIAGVATTHYGLHDTALVYCGVVALLVAAAAVSLVVQRRRQRRQDPQTVAAVPYAKIPLPSVRSPSIAPERDGRV